MHILIRPFTIDADVNLDMPFFTLIPPPVRAFIVDTNPALSFSTLSSPVFLHRRYCNSG
jgi:hypothetical protein